MGYLHRSVLALSLLLVGGCRADTPNGAPDAGLAASAVGAVASTPGGSTLPAAGPSILEVAGPARLAAGSEHACAWTEEGQARCWGSDEHGQVGEEAPPAPAAPSGSGPGLFGVGTLRGGMAGQTCTSPRFPPVRCWRDARSPRLLAVGPVDEIAPGQKHTCARLKDGTVRCWGRHLLGGKGTSAWSVPGIRDAVQLASGAWSICARLRDGTVRCWGDNDKGQLGDGTTEKRGAPVAVKGLSGAVDIAASVGLTCARLEDGTLRCWGWNTLAGGDNQHWKEQPEPAEVKGLGPVAGMTVGGGRVCAWKRDGALLCWGHNTSGEIGDGTTQHRASPVRVDVGGPVAQVAAGGSHTCALRRDGKVLCWGRNNLAQTGREPGQETQPRPAEVPGLDGTVALSAGADFTCARARDGRVRCWGASFHGQAGSSEPGAAAPTAIQLGG